MPASAARLFQNGLDWCEIRRRWLTYILPEPLRDCRPGSYQEAACGGAGLPLALVLRSEALNPVRRLTFECTFERKSLR